ncbi:MAG: hypothetical protein JXB36_20975 [Gammaproteobacteria bacterium]|nr:hypothetical protein [Gammaproteobacteria bacterium]
MRASRPFITTAAGAVALVAGFSFTGSARPEADFESWSTMQREVLKVKQLIGSDVSNGVTPMGTVTDLVLTPDAKNVEFILFKVPYPTSLWGGNDGFVAFEDVVFERGLGLDVEVRFDPEESARLPEDLEISVDELDKRLASRVLDQQIRFGDGAAVEVHNLLVDRRTGAVTHYVIEIDPEAIFRSERRAVPADQVSIGDGGELAVAISLEALEDMQDFDSELL